MVGVFIRLKWRLLRNGVRRTRGNPVAVIGFIVAVIGSLVAAVVGSVVLVGLHGYWDEVARERILAVVCSGVVVGWWFGPFLTGGVDETVDPSRLVLLPLDRRQMRRGQIAAGLVGLAPLVVLTWSVAIAVGMGRSLVGLPVVVAACVLLPLAGLVGSRALATSLARLTRTRRGGDVAALVAAFGGALVFGALQLIRFVEPDDLDAVVRTLRWTPPGMAAAALELARDGAVLDAAWRLVPLAATVLVLGWLWARQLDRLLEDPAQLHGVAADATAADGMAIFAGARRFLPRSATGAAVAKELVYLRRSPGRRAALFAGTALGLVYVVIIVAQGDRSQRLAVLASPIAMLFSVQYASNQLGVDPSAFWLEVVTGPPARARWAGRQLLAAVNVVAPVVVAALAMGLLTGGWAEVVATLVATVAATPAIVGVGSLMSPVWVTPLPDSGNPFAANQSAGGNGCMAGVVAILFVGLIAVLVGPASLALRWALLESPAWAPAVAAVVVAVDATIWWGASRAATALIGAKETDVLAQLDARLNR